MSSAPPPGSGAFAALRGLMRRRPAVHRCELCSLELLTEHPHLLELSTRRLVCGCDACALLFSDQHNPRFRRVPRRVEQLPHLRLTDQLWESLALPINLAFFTFNSAAGRVAAMYPSPAGAMESLLALEAWQILAAENLVLTQLEPDVEALLVNRVGAAREYYRVGIDECYRLVGLIRAGWRGLSGGVEVWALVARFFAHLKEQAGA